MPKGTKIIFSIWGHREGWVFLPTKQGKKWTERSFAWPDEKAIIMKWIEQAEKDKASIYWCPTVFKERKRVKENVEPKINVLWADLDEVHPSEFELTPTIAWESSPGRYQCLWLLDKSIKSDKAEKINRKLTYAIGADKGGWDLTQVLRIPGLRNWKYKKGPKGRLLWNDEGAYEPKEVSRFLKALNNQLDNHVADEEGGHTTSVDEDVSRILKRYSRTLPSKVYELFFTPDDDVSVGERSDRLWELECLLAEAGVKTKDIISLVKMSPWNKFEGRRNEDEQIEAEVYKAKDKVKSLGAEKAIDLGIEGESVTWQSYEGILAQRIKKPEWLIEGIWQDKSHGIVAGEPKTYKSVLTTDIAVAVASGAPVLGKFPVVNPGPVLIVQEENHPYLVQDRLRKMANSAGLLDGKVKRTNKGIKVTFPPALPIRFLNQYGFNLTDESHRKVIEREIKNFNPVLVIFDPMYLMLGGVDENSAKDLRPILNWLIKIRYKYNTGVMMVHHWNKGGTSSRGGQRMLGSATLHAWVESALYCSVRNEVEHEIAVEREFRSFPKPFNIHVKFDMGEPGQLKYFPQVNDETAVTEDGLIELLNGTGGMTEKEILDYTSWPRTTLKRHLEQAMKKGLVEAIGGGRGRGKSQIYQLIKRGADDESTTE